MVKLSATFEMNGELFSVSSVEVWGDPPSLSKGLAGEGAHLLMVLLQATQLFPEGFKLHLQIRPAKGQLIQDLA